MQLTLFTTAGLVVWLVLWSIGQKALDSFMVGALIVLIGATLEILKHYLPNRDG